MLQYDRVRRFASVRRGRWWAGLPLLLWISCVAPVSAHDLAIDQLMLWPDPAEHLLRGELTLNPHLTRAREEAPSARAAERVLAFLAANLRVTVDGRTLPIPYEVRELWVPGGPTLGDLVVFSATLPEPSRELRVFAEGFRALVASVQVARERGGSQTASWLLGAGEGTPVYLLGEGPQQSAWKQAGPEAFVDAKGAIVRDPAPALVTQPERESAARIASPARLSGHFIRLGFEHILPQGVDHILFVVGVVLGNVRRYRRVLLSLTLFTVAHTLTLALSNLLAIHLPPRLVEPLIALSICLVGIDNLRVRGATDGSDAGRQALVFCFGLVHGLGFANALAELSFDRGHLALALFSFNLGVELGQVVVVVLLAVLLCWIREQVALRRYVTLPGSLAIAASGLFLVLERAGVLTANSGL